ncbi:putative transcription factor interactor and regulator CCHC(Zn) family [Helianthus annuus]|uniref:Transcription factor interactor and regulator CCHC(Zn) family n=2 Tax=Helianthus annuus TaxID=4232 RepID=A0A9K3I925_HELAN|nr:putative transcription factor interactor and regulator CCHC(Zn) family [Helianthus annuus]KAJ0894616.1 putative transcription factor interactor and regulator CCHC(Zn) family [Helianthus annuus]
MSLHRNDAQMSEQTAKFAQRIGEVVPKTVELATAMYRLQEEATQEPSKETEAKPSPKPKKRKASKNPETVAPKQAGPSQVAAPPAKNPYNGIAPLCNQCSLHHHVRVKCRKCQICGLIGHTARVCPTIATPNQDGNNPAQARFSPGSCHNCGEMGHFQKKCPKLAVANLTHE